MVRGEAKPRILRDRVAPPGAGLLATTIRGGSYQVGFYIIPGFLFSAERSIVSRSEMSARTFGREMPGSSPYRGHIRPARRLRDPKDGAIALTLAYRNRSRNSLANGHASAWPPPSPCINGAIRSSLLASRINVRFLSITFKYKAEKEAVCQPV